MLATIVQSTVMAETRLGTSVYVLYSAISCSAYVHVCMYFQRFVFKLLFLVWTGFRIWTYLPHCRHAQVAPPQSNIYYDMHGNNHTLLLEWPPAMGIPGVCSVVSSDGKG